MKNMHQIQRFDDFIVDRDAATNGASVTVTVGGIEVVSVKELTLFLDTWLSVTIEVNMVKGASSGLYRTQVNKQSGTGTVEYMGVDLTTTPPIWEISAIASNSSLRPHYGVFLRCSIAGTYKLRVIGTSGGSDSEVAIGDAKMEVLQFR